MKKIIMANEGKLINSKNGFNFKLFDGSITNINDKGSFNLGFKETIYELSKFNSKTRKVNKLNETEVYFILLLRKIFRKEKR